MNTVLSRLFKLVCYCAAALFLGLYAGSCTKEVPDANENVQRMVIKTSSVQEGDDIPVEIKINDAGLTVDNEGWGDPLKNAVFHAVVKNAFGATVDNVVWSGPNGVLSDGGKIDIPENKTLNLVMGALRQGSYSITINLETRYTVDTWASGWVEVLPPSLNYRSVSVKDFTIPSDRDGLELDDEGNLVLDINVFNVYRPFRYFSTIIPDNATNKQLQATSAAPSVLTAGVENESVIVLVPLQLGVAQVNVVSADGAAKHVINVKVVESITETDNYTLPTDSDELDDPNVLFDYSGRLAFDINKYLDGDYYEYVCKPIPSSAKPPVLVAVSDNPEVADAEIVNGNHLRVYPKKVGYANITISKSDGSSKRILRVAVISIGKIVLNAVEGHPSESDAVSGIFPCEIVFSSTTKHLPGAIFFEVYGKAIARADLGDPADNFVEESLRNSRSAFVDFEESVSIGYSARYGNSVYDVYDRLMTNVAGVKFLVHHSADWPNYKDYYMDAKLYKIILEFSCRYDFDTNLYRIDIERNYDNPQNKLYQYL